MTETDVPLEGELKPDTGEVTVTVAVPCAWGWKMNDPLAVPPETTTGIPVNVPSAPLFVTETVAVAPPRIAWAVDVGAIVEGSRRAASTVMDTIGFWLRKTPTGWPMPAPALSTKPDGASDTLMVEPMNPGADAVSVTVPEVAPSACT